MADPGIENLLASLRRQATQSPHQMQQSPLSQQQQQQQQQQPPPPPQQQQQQQQQSPYPPQTLPMEPAQQSPFHPFPYPQHQQYQEPLSYAPSMPQPHSSTPGFPSSNENGYPGFYQPPPQQAIPSNHSPAISSSSQPPYNMPMSPSAGGAGDNRNSLLSLLKFSQAVPLSDPPLSEQAFPPQGQRGPTPPRPAVNSPPPIAQPPIPHNRSISASDLVAALFNNASRENIASSASSSPVHQRTPIHLLQQRSATAESVPQNKAPVNPQDLVFQHLGRTKPAQEELGPSPATPNQEVASTAEHNRGEQPLLRSSSSVSSMPPPPPNYTSAGPSHGLPSLPAEGPPPSHTPSKGLFTYVNPFEQLSATSPRNKAPKSGTPGPLATRKSTLGTSEMRAEDFPLPGSTTASPPPAPVEAEAAKEASALDQVKEREQQLMEQLAQHAEEYVPSQEPAEESRNEDPQLEPSQQHEGANDTAAEVQQQENDTLPAPAETKAPVQEHVEGEEDGYESAPETQIIEVYNFPMKPFSSITINPTAIKRPKYPSSKISDVARMARTFDQLDRNLIAASHQYIAYALAKSNGRGGIRILRQYDGLDKVLMKDSTDRTFNVTIGKSEKVLATGVSGAVVWFDLQADFDGGKWDSMFVFPPSEEQGQSNGVLKSRARKTSRHLDAFAIGRGKTISIIHAPTARAYAEGRKGNVVASKKYLADHARTIDTGKASKDFAFSDDDSVIISIDKAGKLKLWDVLDLLNFTESDAYDIAQTPEPPMFLSTPNLVFSAVAAGETYRATSVMFLDKFRPYLKCLALRYVIVGMKQNHTFQLWDLALGRPVQEINFPQESDTDALCSVAYHPLSGIIVVGNPTRNSIYFIHLSAPKYNLPPMSQAQYIRGLADKSSTIPKPDATAILSGLREYSFAPKGQLMSLDILDYESEPQDDNPVLFELYIAHSKGMTTLSVYKEDLGWDMDSRVKNSVDAIAKGVCVMSSLPPPPPPERDEKSEIAEPPAQALKPKPSGTKSRSVSPAARAAEKPDVEDKSVANSAGKKKKKDKASASASAATTSGTDEPQAEKAASAKSKAPAATTPAAQSVEQELGVSSGFLDREVKRIEQTVSAEFSRVINAELEQLYRRIDNDMKSQQADGDAKQATILRLLSSSLTENVEQVISRIVVTNIQEHVVPAISDVTATSVGRVLGETLTRSLAVSLPQELRATVPNAVSQCLAQPELLNRVSESMSRPLTQVVERELTHCIHSTIVPAIQKLTVDTAQKVIAEAERKHSEAIFAMEQMHRNDSRKIDQLIATVQQMAEAMNNMAKNQAEFQEQVRQAQVEYYELGGQAIEPEKSAEQLEAEEIEELLRSGKYEDGTIKWLQSKERQAELFDEVMVRYRYDFLPNLSQLVLLSVSAAVSVKFEQKVMERLSWLEGVLAVLDPMDPEIHEICNRIMVVVVQRLEQLYMSTAEMPAHQNQQLSHPILKKIPAIARRARELSAVAHHPR